MRMLCMYKKKHTRTFSLLHRIITIITITITHHSPPPRPFRAPATPSNYDRMSSSSSLPNPPQPSPSHSAILFSGTLVRRLESDPSLRLPSTYIGVRRVRASRSTASVPSTAATAVGTGKRKRGGLDDDGTKEGVGEKDDGEIGDNVVDDASSSQAEAFTTTTSTNNDNNDDDDDGQIVYKVTNPDGTQRRMNTKEKKQLKYALKVAKLKAKKEERQRKHHEMILEAKAGKRERKRLKNLAWREKQRKRQQQEQEQQQQGQQQGQPQQPQQKQQQQEGEKQQQIQQQGQQPQSTKEKVTQIKDQKSSTPPEQTKKDDVVDAQPPATLSLLEEELASFRGERRGIPPVMLTPAATLVAQHHGVLSPTTAAAAAAATTTATATTTKTKTKTIMDPHLSEQWARQLQRSMIPAEISRSKEDMRPMAYKLVPEVWKSLCPPSLWSADASSTSIDNEGRPGDDGDDDPKDGHKTEEGAQETTSTASKSTSNPSSSSSPLPPTTTNTALVQLRNPSPSYDTDASLIFQHLHQHSPHLHVACGALFGCDFLLYDGKRDERHSFAGMRIYSTTSHNNSDNDSSGEEKTTTTITKFPIPSAYDMAGFVRTMNTARKIALVATVVRERINDGKVARVVIVDLALEKILTAQTHIRKGTTDKRKSEEEKASGLAKTK
mmetsp:Transcript_36489/g.76938  ORF Transcript_36489/g.76938 Transcript_36489/m.76938 type:complete len:666 (-) Transcript_36489:22-2019(-)